jgi:hypothetical protein
MKPTRQQVLGSILRDGLSRVIFVARAWHILFR